MANKTEYSGRQVITVEDARQQQGQWMWHLGMFFVVFGFIAIIVVGNRVFATLNTNPNALGYQLPASSAHYNNIGNEQEPNVYWKDYKVAAGQNLSLIFKHLNIDTSFLRDIMRANPLAGRLENIKPGKIIKFRYVDDEFAGLEYVVGPTSSILVVRKGDAFAINEVKQDYEKQTRYVSATVEASLFQSAKKAGLSEKTTVELSKIFGWDIDFALDIQPGDRFSVVYQVLYHDDEKIKDGDILAAEFVNNGKTYRAVRYQDPEGHSGYYSPEGINMRKPFLRTPVDFTRISSYFGSRKHPVMNKMRMHKGVDYAAPRGTVVKASGKGKIIFRGSLRGYGKTVIIQHGERYRTLYAHLDDYRRAQRMGSFVNQGDPIGYVGSSGLATGPHLHYEFLVDGVHRDPLDIKLAEDKPIGKAYRQDFKLRSSSMLTLLDMVSNATLAMNI